jgi:nucleotide-binding universal stress UspA family protein
MNNILYATDYSENSVAALHFAYGISKKLNAQLTVVHVFDVPLVLGNTTSITYARKEVKAFVRDREKLKEFCTRHLGSEPEKLDIAIKIEEDSPIWKGILEKAEEIEADLIVVGAKGDSPIRRYLLGSTTTDLIEKADCPVLAIPHNTSFQSIENIVYASDMEGSDIFTIEDLVTFADPFDARIHLVHITNKDRKTSEEQMKWFKNMLRHKVSYENVHFEIRFGVDVFETLRNYVNEIEPDMVVMLEREGKSLIKDLWHRDLVKRMKSEGHYPLLSFNKKNIGT